MKEDFRNIHHTLGTGYIIGSLPIGCRYCLLGAKAVVFITGKCLDYCWYCPISREKFGKDVMFVNERRVYSLNDVIDEVYRIGGLGASITGGDPILVLDRTYNVVSMLKKEFGKEFHIHLYTSGKFIDRGVLEILESSGLDEVRFHVYTMDLIDRVQLALDYDMDVGVELPFIPLKQYIEYLKNILYILDDIGVKFLNLNEFEVSETNIENVILHGLTPKGITVEGAEKKALKFIKWAAENTRDIAIHYCTVKFKDNIQFRLRMLRKAINTMGLHEIPTRDGTLISIEVIEGDTSNQYIIKLNDRKFIMPEKAYMLRGSGSRVIIREYYPDQSNKPINIREIIY